MLTFCQKKCYNVLYKAVVKRAVVGHAKHAQKTACLIDANMYEHGAVRSNARMRIHVAAA